MSPIFEYKCQKCQARFEKLISPCTKNQEIICPGCGGKKVKKQISKFSTSNASSCGGCSSCCDHK